MAGGGKRGRVGSGDGPQAEEGGRGGGGAGSARHGAVCCRANGVRTAGTGGQLCTTEGGGRSAPNSSERRGVRGLAASALACQSPAAGAPIYTPRRARPGWPPETPTRAVGRVAPAGGAQPGVRREAGRRAQKRPAGHARAAWARRGYKGSVGLCADDVPHLPAVPRAVAPAQASPPLAAKSIDRAARRPTARHHWRSMMAVRHHEVKPKTSPSQNQSTSLSRAPLEIEAWDPWANACTSVLIHVDVRTYTCVRTRATPRCGSSAQSS